MMFLFAAFSVASAVIAAGGDCSGQYSVTQCKEDHECRRPKFGKQCVETDFDDSCTCQIIFCQNAQITLHKLDHNGERKICNIGGLSTDLLSNGHLCWPGCYQQTEIDTGSFLGFFKTLGTAITQLEPYVCRSDIYAVNNRNCGDDAVPVSDETQHVLDMAQGESPFLNFLESFGDDDRRA